MKKCTKCILPENYPGIKFNEKGICNFCLAYKKAESKGLDRLEKIFKKYRNKNKDYDCLVGISGGRDSSYALYYLVKKCNLRVLAYSADNGFIPMQCKINMKNMTDILNVKLIIDKHNFLTKCIKYNIQTWLRKPSPAMIPMICCGCRLGIFRGLLKCAKMYKIPLVVIGSGNPAESSKFKKEFFAVNPLGKIINAKVNKVFSFLFGYIYEIIKNPLYFLKPINTIIYLKEYFYCFHSNAIRKYFFPKQKTVRLYRYIDWNEDIILNIIKNELSWKKSDDNSSSWRFDCLISNLKNYILKKSVGFTEKDEMYSKMIRLGWITREEALNRISCENVTPWNLVKKIYDDIK